MSSNVARRLNITPMDDQYIILLAANGEQMHVDGHALIMTSSQGVDTLVDAIISPHMQEEMLVSWVDLQAMGRIPKGFPNQILGARRRRQKKKNLTATGSVHHARQTFSKQSKRAGNSNAPRQPSPDRRAGEIRAGESRTQAGNGRTKKRAANSNAQKEEKGKRTEKKPKHSSNELSPSDSLKDKLLNCLLYTSPSPRDS